MQNNMEFDVCQQPVPTGRKPAFQLAAVPGGTLASDKLKGAQPAAQNPSTPYVRISYLDSGSALFRERNLFPAGWLPTHTLGPRKAPHLATLTSSGQQGRGETGKFTSKRRESITCEKPSWS